MPEVNERHMQAATIAQFFTSHALVFAIIWLLVIGAANGNDGQIERGRGTRLSAW